ncbi:MAG TPA: squalene/phytoene synthase family protein [Stenomitos sp.]
MARMTPDWERCFELLPKVSRTFALSISLLKPALRQAVCVAYLLCRVVDTLEDASNLTVERKAQRIQELRALIAGRVMPEWHREIVQELQGGAAAHDLELLASLPEVLAALSSLPLFDRQGIGRCFDEMAIGMVEMQEVIEAHRTDVRQLPTMESLRRYCHYVAGTVGYLLTELFYLHSEAIEKSRYFELLNDAESFGQALQLINILKDVAEDHAKGWCFLPREVLAARNLVPGRLFDEGQRVAAIEALAPLVAEVIAQTARSWRYLTLIPVEEREIRLFLGYSLFFGIQTIRRALEDPDLMLDPERKLKISRLEVGVILAEVTQRIDDPERLEKYQRSLWQAGGDRLDERWPEQVRTAVAAACGSTLSAPYST